MRRLLAVLAPIVVLAAPFAACSGSRVPTPEIREHPRGAREATCVPYPPPAAKPESLGLRPSDRAVWVDGDWNWKSLGAPESTAGKWVWQPGGWVEPPYGATYSRGTLTRLPNGALAWYPPHWHLPAHYVASVDAAAPLASNGAPLACPTPEPNETTAAPKPLGDAGEEVHTGPALLYLADAPSSAPPKVVLDAIIPSDTKKPTIVIQPPE